MLYASAAVLQQSISVKIRKNAGLPLATRLYICTPGMSTAVEAQGLNYKCAYPIRDSADHRCEERGYGL
jgi:hypothetical protein